MQFEVTCSVRNTSRIELLLNRHNARASQPEGTEVDAETWTRLSKIYRSLSDDECRHLRAAAHGDFSGITAATWQKFLELKLVQADAGKAVITPDGRRIAQWG